MEDSTEGHGARASEQAPKAASESLPVRKNKLLVSALEVYKAYLHCAAKVIRSEGGEITAYDGDRIMAVYIGGSKSTSAARSAL